MCEVLSDHNPVPAQVSQSPAAVLPLTHTELKACTKTFVVGAVGRLNDLELAAEVEVCGPAQTCLLENRLGNMETLEKTGTAISALACYVLSIFIEFKAI